MKTKTIRLPKLHLIAQKDEGFREVLNHILVTKEHVVVSDAMKMVVVPTESIFSKELIDKFPDRFLIHWRQWKMFHNCYNINFQDDHFEVRYKKHSISFKIIYESELQESFPSWERVMKKDTKPKKIQEIGINPSYLKDVADAMIPQYEYNRAVKVTFYGETESIFVTPIENPFNAEGIVMPVMINY